MIESLVRDFRRGNINPAKLRRAQSDAFTAFQLHRSVNVRPSMFRNIMAVDDMFLSRLSRQVAKSRFAGSRIGTDWVPHRRNAVEPQSDDDVWVTREDLRPLDDVCTKFVTQKFLPDAFARVSFVGNVMRLYDRLAQASHGSFRIVFKGGVMQRLLLVEFWQNMPISVRNDAIAYLRENKAISISDMDFEISTSRDDASTDSKHRLLVLTFATLLWLQSRIAHDIDRGASEILQVDWNRDEGATELRAHLQEAVGALDPTHPMHGVRVDSVYIGGTDPAPPRGYKTRKGAATSSARRNLFVFDHGGKPCVADAVEVLRDLDIVDVPSGSCDAVYATYNSYINENNQDPVRSDHLPPLFHLARIKHSFVVYYTTREGHRRCDRLAGELVDLSQGDPADRAHAWLVAELRRTTTSPPYRDIPVLGSDGTATIRSYTIPYLMVDHVLMLHRNDVPPWEVNKYEKRLLRYVAFFIAHVLSPDVPGSYHEKLRALQAAVDHTRTAKALTASVRTPTRVAPVDAFVARERASVQRGAGPYLQTLHAHLRTLVSFAARPESWERRTLDGFHMWHDDHVPH